MDLGEVGQASAFPRDFSAVAAQVLGYLRATIGLDLWLVGRRLEDDWVVLSADGPPELASPGLRLPWESTFCSQVEAGRAQWVTPDVDQDPVMLGVREALGLPVRAFVTVPLHGDHGELLGTLCGAGLTQPGIKLADCRSQLDLFAGVLGALLSTELKLEREARSREVAELAAETDALTGVGNRRSWDRLLASEEVRCSRYGLGAAVLTVDANGLKGVNDRWGHDAGDELLRRLAGVLRHECRPVDAVCRLGGDEFAILLVETQLAQAEVVADRLREALLLAQASAAIGVAVRSGDGLVDTWQRADALMLEDKRRVPHRHIQPAAAPRVDAAQDVLVAELLALARQHLKADIAYVLHFDDTQAVVRAIDSVGVVSACRGSSQPLTETLSDRLVRGELPSAIPDTAQIPELAALQASASYQIAAYVGVPLHLADGSLYGTLCCLSHTPNPAFDHVAVRFLGDVARSLSPLLASEESETAERQQAVRDVDDVLNNHGFSMAFQPIVDLRTGAVGGVEALARFHDPRRTTAQWFDDAARVERTADLELDTATVALAEATGWPGLVWLKLSASVLLSPGLADVLQGQDLGRLVVEVSEHEPVPDYESVRQALRPFREQGLRLAVDDAGAGFASLRHVLELTPDFIKLDISLVHGLPGDPARGALVNSLVAFAAQSGAVVVAEGIESESELTALLSAGVSLGQGYFLGQAAPARYQLEVLRVPVPVGS